MRTGDRNNQRQHSAIRDGTYSREIRLCYYSRTRIQGKLHLANLLVDVLHEPATKREREDMDSMDRTYSMMKSTSLCLSIVSPWKFVTKNEIS